MALEIWKPAPNNPGFEINQKGQLRSINMDPNINKKINSVKKDPPYKPFQGKEWPKENLLEDDQEVDFYCFKNLNLL